MEYILFGVNLSFLFLWPQVFQSEGLHQMYGLLLHYLSVDNVDAYSKSKAIHLLTRALTGFRPLYFHPSMKSQSSAQNFHQKRQKELAAAIVEQHIDSIKEIVISLLQQWLYSPSPREHFMSTAPRGDCLASTILQFISVLVHSSPVFDAISCLEKAVNLSRYVVVLDIITVTL